MMESIEHLRNNRIGFASWYTGIPFSRYHVETDSILAHARMDMEKFETDKLLDTVYNKHHEFVRKHGFYPNSLFVNKYDYRKLVSNTNFYHDYTDTSNIVEKFMDMQIIRTIDSEPYVGFVI